MIKRRRVSSPARYLMAQSAAATAPAARPPGTSLRLNSREWLDSNGAFIFGKHAGELAEDVAHADPAYLRWVINEVEDCADADRDLLSALLARR